MKLVAKYGRVWLIAWECIGDHAKPKKNYAAILDHRYSNDRIKWFIEQLYHIEYCSLAEQVSMAKSRSSVPYPAQYEAIRGVRFMDRISCGHNPFLTARQVKNLEVFRTADGDEDLKFEEVEYNYERFVEMEK